MKKKHLLLTLPLLAGMLLTSCGGTIRPTDPADDGKQGSYSRKSGDWDKLLNRDYSNSTVYSYVSIGESESYIYNLAEGKYMEQYLIGEEVVKQFFADYEGENYVYWDCTHDPSRPNGKKGWINYNDKYEVPLSLEHQDFYFPNLYEITSEMVEYDGLFQEYYIKDEYLADVDELLFGYAWDNKAEAISITTSRDEDGYEVINRIWAFDDLEKGEDAPFVMVQFGYIGTTMTPEIAGFPEEITEDNIYDYWEITGEDYEPPVYPEAINLECIDIHESEPGYDVVMTVGDTLEFRYSYTNQGVNKFGINTFNPDASDYRDDEGNYYPEFYELVGAFNIETCWDEKCSYFQARNEGEIEVYVTYYYPGHPLVTSNKVKIKVNPVKPQPITDDTVYEINASSSKDEFNDPVWGRDSGYYQTVLTGVNSKEKDNYHPIFDMSGYLVTTLDGRYTETFEDVSKTFDFPLGSASSYGVNYGMYRYLEFDLKDQEVVKLSFMYSLHTSGQLAYMKSNLTEAYVATSNDGENWTTVKDMKDEMLSEFSKDSYMVGLTNHLMEVSFTKTSHVRIYFDAGYYGQYFEMILANIAFDKDDTCAMHVDKPLTPVTGVTIDQESPTVRIGNTTKLSATVSPNDATNQKIYWTSADHTIAQVNQKGEVKGMKQGKTKIIVYTDEFGPDGLTPFMDEIEIEVLGKATLPEGLLETDFYSASSQEGKYALQITGFNVTKGTFDVTYKRLNRYYNATVSLTNEENGIYTAIDGDDTILVFSFNNDLSVITIYPESCKVKSFAVDSGITDLLKEDE